MAHQVILLDKKPLGMRRSVITPDWQSEKVLTSDLWTYVDLWIRRNARDTNASFFWLQSQEFYKASLGLPITASPLTLYYCFLNATKALLSAKRIPYSGYHGLSGASVDGKASLSNEKVTLKAAGVLPSLISYYGDAPSGTYSLRDLLANMAFVHRAYCLSYSQPYAFFSLDEPVFVAAVGSSEAWISAEMEQRYNDLRVLRTLPTDFERNGGFLEKLIIRRKKRFRWKSGRGLLGDNLKGLTKYHRELRRGITYIAGTERWYLRRSHSSCAEIDRHLPTMIFATMHRLSELSRYDPLRLSKLFDTQRNWILAEFIKTAPYQFLDEIACELTGQEINVPGIHSGSPLSAT